MATASGDRDSSTNGSTSDTSNYFDGVVMLVAVWMDGEDDGYSYRYHSYYCY